MFKNVVSFLFGASIGAGATYYILKDKYEKQTQEDINQIKEEYKQRFEENCPYEVEAEEDIPEEKKFTTLEDKPDIMQVQKADNIINYSGYSKKEKDMPVGDNKRAKRAKDMSAERKAEKYKKYDYDPEEDYIEEDDEEDEYNEDLDGVYPKEGPIENPYSISPEQFAVENPYYDKITLNYYESDDTLVDEDENIIQEIAETVGNSFRTMFDEYENDVCYIRNEKLGADYEVLRQHCNYFNDSEV